MKNKLLVVSLVLVLAAAMVLGARPIMRDMRPGQGRHGQGMFANENVVPVRLLLKVKAEIGLSVEQEKKLMALNEAHEQWLIKFQAENKLKALKLRTSLEAEKVNLKEAEGLIRAQADMHAEMQIARLHFQQEVKALLTAEQLVKVNELKKEFLGRVRQMGRERRDMRRADRN